MSSRNLDYQKNKDSPRKLLRIEVHITDNDRLKESLVKRYTWRLTTATSPVFVRDAHQNQIRR